MSETNRALFRALPGTISAPCGLFIDRWGTLLELNEKGYAEAPEEVKFIPGALDALFRAYRAGWRIYLIGNEDAVPFGALSKAKWDLVEQHIAGVLQDAGIQVMRSYLCTTRLDGVGEFQVDSVFQLPNTGAFYHALHTDGIDLQRSWVVGDSTTELVAGWRSGMRMAAVRTGEGLGDRIYDVSPEIVADDLHCVIQILLEQAQLSA